jgi:hypothetical protein
LPKVIARQGWAPKKAERYLIWEVSLVFPLVFLVFCLVFCIHIRQSQMFQNKDRGGRAHAYFQTAPHRLRQRFQMQLLTGIPS